MPTLTSQARALAAFLDRNPGFDIHAFHRTPLDGLAWDGLDRPQVLDALRRAERLRHAVPDPLMAYRIAEAGYGSLGAIARRATSGFVEDLQGVLGPELARTIQARARGAHARIVQQWMRTRESISQHRRAYLGPRAVQATAAPGEGTPAHYGTLFGEAPIRDTPEAMSILGPGAYFVDLMSFVDEEITRQNPGIPPTMTLRARRPDLWNLPLTIGTVEDRISQADLTRQILESTLLQLAPSVPLLTGAGAGQRSPRPSNVHWCAGQEELAAALEDARDGDLIVVTGKGLGGSTLRIDKSVTLKAGAEGVTFDCSAATAFEIHASKVAIEDIGFVDVGAGPAILVTAGSVTLADTLFVCSTAASSADGWAVACSSGEVAIRNSTFSDPTSAPTARGAMLAATGPATSSATFTVVSSILWTADETVSAGRLFSFGAGPAVFNLAYCDVRGGDPGKPEIYYDDTNFVADPGFPKGATDWLRLPNDSPCVGRGARGANVGAGVYDIYAAMARAIYPFDTPFDAEVQSAVLALDELDLSLPEIFKTFAPFGAPGPFSGVSALGLGLGEVEVLSTPIQNDADLLAGYYGLESFDGERVVLTADAPTYTFRAADFARWTGLTPDGLRELVYQDLSHAEIAAGVQRGNVAWATIPAKPWPGFWVNAGQDTSLALHTVFAPVGCWYPTFSAGTAMGAKLPAGVSGDGSFTVSSWVYAYDVPAVLLSLEGPQGQRLLWDLDANHVLTLRYGSTSYADILQLAAPIPTHRWVCLTTAYDAPSKKICVYVNGRPAGIADASVIDATFWSGGSLYLSPGNPSTLGAADVALWAIARAPEDIAREFQRPPMKSKGDAPPQGLNGYWPMNDDGSGGSGDALANWAGSGAAGQAFQPFSWGEAYLSKDSAASAGATSTLNGLAFVETEIITGEDDAGEAGLSLENLDRVNRFVRLARRLGWSFADLDWALYTILPDAPSELTALGAFDQLALLGQLHAETEIPLTALCAFFGHLKPYGRGSEADALPLFDQVYNRPPLAGMYFTPVMSHPLVLPGDAQETPDGDTAIARRVAANLGLSTADLRRVVASAAPPETEPSLALSWASLSALFRFRVLLSLFEVDVEGLIQLLSYAGVDPFAPALAPAQLLRLVEIQRVAAAAEIAPASLRYLITDPATIDPPEDPYQKNLEQRFRNNLGTLQGGLRRDLAAVRVAPQSFVRPGVGLGESTTYFDACVSEGYVTRTGLVRSKLLSALPEVALRVPAQYPTIQEAVTAAVASLKAGAASAVVLIAPGEYSGAGNARIAIEIEIGKGETLGALAIRSEAGAESTVIDCKGSESGPVLSIVASGEGSGAGVIVDGLTIVQSTNLGNGTFYFHGVAPIAVRGCQFWHNEANSGGGLYISLPPGQPGPPASTPEPPDVVVQDCVFYANTAAQGYAIYAENARIHLSASTLYGNGPPKGSPGGSGGYTIYNQATEVRVEHSILPDDASDASLFTVGPDSYTGDDPGLVDPEHGNFALKPGSDARADGYPGYRPNLTSGPEILFSFAFVQLEVLRKAIVAFLACGDLPLVPILRYLGPVENGIEILGGDDPGADPIAYLRCVYLYLLLAFEFELSGPELALLLADPAVFVSLPDGGDVPWIPRQRDLPTLARYLLLKKEYPGCVPDLLGYLRAARQRRLGAATGPDTEAGRDATNALADLFGWDPVDVGALLAARREALVASGDDPAEIWALSTILDVSRALDMAGGTGLGIGLLRELTRNGLVFGGNGATPLIEAIAGADAAAADRLRGRISEMKRSILRLFAVPLVDQVTPSEVHVQSEDNLSEYLLADVAMGAETDTSRVVQATLSLQQYVQRARLGLEPGITRLDISDTYWGWMSSYRTWEANRRVFLYPENYLRPDLRKDKTPLFVQLSDALSEVEITKERVEELFKGYVGQLATQANLRTVGAWYTDEASSGIATASGEPVGRYHLVARTPTQPYAYHYRTYMVRLAGHGDARRTAARWTPWEPVELDVLSDHASPVVFRGQCYLFWAESVFLPDDQDDVAGGHHQITLKYAVRKPDGAWGPAQAPFPTIQLPPDVDPASDAVWRKPYVVPTAYEGAPALLVQYGGYASACDPFLFVLRMDQTVVGGLTFRDDMAKPEALQYSALAATQNPGKIRWLQKAPISTANALPLREIVASACTWLAFGVYYMQVASISPGATSKYKSDFLKESGSILLSDGLPTTLAYYDGRYYFAQTKVGKLYATQSPGLTDGCEILTDGMVPSADTSGGAPQIAGAHGWLYAVYQKSNSPAGIQLIRSRDGRAWESVIALVNTNTLNPSLSAIGETLYGVYGKTGNAKALSYFRKTEREWETGDLLGWNAPNTVQAVSQLVYWRGAWYCAAACASTNAVQLLSAPKLSSNSWKGVGVSPSNVNVDASQGLGLVATAEALYICYGQASTKVFQIISCAGGSPLDPWKSPVTGVNTCGPVSPFSRGAYAAGTSGDLLGSPGDAPEVVPVGNQLGAFIVGTDGGDYLVEVIGADKRPVNVSVNAEVQDGTVSLSSAVADTGPASSGTDFSKCTFQFRRLSSTAAVHLVKTLSERGIDALMSPDSQRTAEYDFKGLSPASTALAPPDATIGFGLEDAFGLYYRELFYFVPWLLATKLRESLRFKEAQRWLEYVFCPTGLTGGESYWRSVWLDGIPPAPDPQRVEPDAGAAMAIYLEDPFDAVAVANLRPSAYQKAIFMAYVQNLLDWGDDRFAMSTRETINEAAQIYRFAADLLGPEPKLLPYVSPRPETYADLAPPQIVGASARSALDPPVDLKLSTDYEASGDGFVTAMIWWANSGDRGYLLASTAGSSEPSPLRGAASMHYYLASSTRITQASLTLPVRARDHYDIAYTVTSDSPYAGASLVPLRPRSGVTFGAWSAVDLGRSHTAPSDGFVVGVLQCTATGDRGCVTGSQTRGSETLSVVSSAQYSDASNTNTYVLYESLCMPVLAGASYEVQLTSTSGKPSAQAFFLPLHGGALEPWASRVADTSYEAECDGFLLAMIEAPSTTSNAYGSVNVYVADTEPGLASATPRARASAQYNASPLHDVRRNSAMVPVGKGSFYKASESSVSGQINVSLWWFPLVAIGVRATMTPPASTSESLVEIAPAAPVPAAGYDPNGGVVIAGAYFGVLDNPRFSNTWGEVNDRLFKIRHGLDLNGTPRPVLLFDPQLDPLDFVRAPAAGGQGSTMASSGGVADFEWARETIRTAKELAQSVMELGRSLLSTLEAKDTEALAALQARQQAEITDQLRKIRVEEVNEARATLQSLESARASAQLRKDHYEVLVRRGLSAREATALRLSKASLAMRAMATAANTLSAPLYLLPNIAGAAFGGMEFGGAAAAVAATYDSLGTTLGEAASITTTEAEHQRRAEEWGFEAQLAGHDVAQLDAEIQAAALRVRQSEMQYALEATSLRQAQEVDQYYQSRFTNAELYQWMANTLGDLHYQLFQIADGAARSAQSVVNDLLAQNATYVSPGAWSAQHRGLLAGERLYVDLARMEQDLLRWAPPDTSGATVRLSRSDPAAVIALQTRGECVFDVREEDFDRAHPGQYLRRIREITVQLCGWEGEAVHGELVQLAGSVVRRPEVDAVCFLLGRERAPGAALGRQLREVRARFSTESGTTAPLAPFAGAPGVGRFRLSIAPSAQRFDLLALRDVVLHVRYDARDGGDAFRSAVAGALPPFRDRRLIDVAAANPDGWARLVEGADRCEIRIDRKGFARNLPGRAAKVTRLGLYLTFAPRSEGEEVLVGCAPWLADRKLPIPAAGGTVAVELPVSIGLDELCRREAVLRLGEGPGARSALRAAHLIIEATEE